MGHPTKVQVIQRRNGEQWYVNFPAAVAHALKFDGRAVGEAEGGLVQLGQQIVDLKIAMCSRLTNGDRAGQGLARDRVCQWLEALCQK